MTTTAGIYTESVLLDALARADALRMDGRTGLQFQPRIGIMKLLQAVQTARITELENVGKNFTVRVEWPMFCAGSVVDDTACDTCSTEPSTNVKQMTITKHKSTCELIDESVFTTNTFDAVEMSAKALLVMERRLLEWLAGYLITTMNVNAGVNTLGTTSIGTVAGNITTIPAANWTGQAVMPYLGRVAENNQFVNPALGSGGLLYESWLAAKVNNGNANGKGDSQMFDMFGNMIFDEFNMAAINGATNYAYLVSQGALALASKTYFTPQMRDRGTWKTVAYDGKLYPGITYDLLIKETCTDHGLSKIDMKMVFNGDILVNPLGCDQGNTGILRFQCVN